MAGCTWTPMSVRTHAHTDLSISPSLHQIKHTPSCGGKHSTVERLKVCLSAAVRQQRDLSTLLTLCPCCNLQSHLPRASRVGNKMFIPPTSAVLLFWASKRRQSRGECEGLPPHTVQHYTELHSRFLLIYSSTCVDCRHAVRRRCD